MRELGELDLKGTDVISINDFSREKIDFILGKAELIEKLDDASKSTLLKGKIMASLFFEPSTRTKDSFNSAMTRLGGTIIGFDSEKSTSIKKGETVWDTAKMYDRYADVIVMRHRIEGAARRAAEAASIPVINGGDGANQHPTQTLLDLYTIRKTQGRIDGLSVAMCGDLKYGRTVHSLAVALSHYGCRLYFVAPKSLKMPSYIIRALAKKGIIFSEHDSLEEVIPLADVLYMTRIQKERFPDEAEYEKVSGVYILKADMLKNAKENMKVMHPLPRVDEIDADVDETKHAVYFEQAGNGIPVRQALLCLVMGRL
jgi:aspartate carbamoyltransferase catalytic subunit